MARGRMIDKSFVKSQKLNQLERSHRLAYAMILPFLDREGRTVAEPIVLMALVFRWSDFTLEEIAESLAAMARVRLVRLYADRDNTAIIQYERFDEFNSPNVKEAKSDLPGPDDGNATEVRDEVIVPLLAHASATTVQSTGNARAMQMENGTLTERQRQRRTEADADSSEPEPEVEAESVEPAGDPNSSEAKFQRVMETGTSEHNETSRTRSTLKRLFGPFFATKNEESLQAWSRWSDKQLRTFMEASDPKLWPGEENKRREWILSDLLNELRSPPDPTTGNVDHLLRKYHHVEGTHEGNHFTVVGCTPDGKRLMTDIGTLTIQEVEEGSCHTTN